MSPTHPLHGLVAAAHTPFHRDGSLNLALVEPQAAHLLRSGLTTVFINGTTGECSSLSLEERRALAQRWLEVVRGSKLKVSVHVGSNCLGDARALAAHAEQAGAISISAFAPSYFKPPDLDVLIAWCAQLADAAPETPFYFYDIPAQTSVSLSMPEFLERAPARVPTLAGLKFTNRDLLAYQLCLKAGGGRYDVAYGYDEWLLAALALGARGAVGCSYNFAAPLYRRLLRAFVAGDLETARREQVRSAQLIQTLADRGFMGATKAVMALLGVDVGPARLPNISLDVAQTRQLRHDLEALGFFDWIQPERPAG
jgi:N-acetylneuraminate lyase